MDRNERYTAPSLYCKFHAIRRQIQELFFLFLADNLINKLLKHLDSNQG